MHGLQRFHERRLVELHVGQRGQRLGIAHQCSDDSSCGHEHRENELVPKTLRQGDELFDLRPEFAEFVADPEANHGLMITTENRKTEVAVLNAAFPGAIEVLHARSQRHSCVLHKGSVQKIQLGDIRRESGFGVQIKPESTKFISVRITSEHSVQNEAVCDIAIRGQFAIARLERKVHLRRRQPAEK